MINEIFQNILNKLNMDTFPSLSTELIDYKLNNNKIFTIKSPIDQSFLATIKITDQDEYVQIISNRFRSELKHCRN